MNSCLSVATVSTLARRMSPMSSERQNTHPSGMRCTNGFSFPGRGGADARLSIGGVNVAVNRQVCRSVGRAFMITPSSFAKVGCSRRSASSRTRKRTRSSDHSARELLLRWSTIRPGVAMTTCGRLQRSMACCIMSMPPTTTAVRIPREPPITLNWSAIWNASSLCKRRERVYSTAKDQAHLVGVSTRANMPYGSTESF